MPAAYSYSAAILVGGLGRRMGGTAKHALRLGHQPILTQQLEILRTMTDDIVLVGRSEAALSAPSTRFVTDLVPGAGPLGAVLTALTAARYEQVLVLACDMPFVSAAFLAHLAACGDHVDAAVPRDARGWHPLCASYRRQAKATLRARLEAGALSLIDAVTRLHLRVIDADELRGFDPHERLLFNINTPDEYAAAIALLTPPVERTITRS